MLLLPRLPDSLKYYVELSPLDKQAVRGCGDSTSKSGIYQGPARRNGEEGNVSGFD